MVESENEGKEVYSWFLLRRDKEMNEKAEGIYKERLESYRDDFIPGAVL